MKILLRAGHGGKDPGSQGADGIWEKDRTMELTNLIAIKIRNAGHTVDAKQEKDANGDWVSKNRTGYDAAYSIHFNSFNKTATGVECYYKTVIGKAADMAKAVADVLGLTNRGPKQTANFYMLNIGFDGLLEVCFHDNQKDLDAYNRNKDKVADTIANCITGGATATSSTYTGDSLVDYLKSIKVDSSYTYREKLAKQYGVAGYTGTAKQNTQLLNAMRGNQKVTTSSAPTAPAVNYYKAFSNGSIVDGLKSIGVDSSPANRKQIASANGISGYTGTAGQNNQLLALAKQGKLIKA